MKGKWVWVLLSSVAMAQPPGGGPGGRQGDGIWRRNAFYGESQTFDACVGHQPGSGDYHHHANPICLRAQLNDNLQLIRSSRTGSFYQEKGAPWTHSPILGWALDGYPIYGPYGYADPLNPSSGVKRLKPGYRLRSISARVSLPDWSLPNHAGVSQTLSAAQYGPPINAQFPLGRYNEDFEFVSGLGDLDLYNGRQEVTPEYPQGTYAYHVAIEDSGAPAFPYIFAGQFYGTATGGNAQAVPGTGVQDYFNSSLTTQPTVTETSALLTSWQTRNAGQAARVSSGFDPSAGPSTIWPTNVPAGARYSGGSASVALADAQRVRFSASSVYVNANGLAAYVMGPWFDATMSGGVFSNFPAAQTVQMQFPRAPAAATTRTSTPLGPCGLWVNGVSVFNFLDGGSYSNAQGGDVGGGTVVATASHLSAASSENGPAAPGSIMSAYAMFGAVFAASAEAATTLPWPTALSGITVTIKDSQGVSAAATIAYVSPTQINYRLPTPLASGYATATISNGSNSYTTNLNILATYPNLFQSDATGAAAGYVTRLRNGTATNEPLAGAVDLGPATDQVYLVLFGSGLGSAADTKATVGGVSVTPVYAGPQGTYAGMEQFNLLIPRSLAGAGKIPVVITAAGRPSNPVTINLQ